MLHSCIVFTLTGQQIDKIFDQHINFDLRKLLGGTDVLLDSLAKSFSNPWLAMDAIPCIKIPSKLRNSLKKAWNNSEIPQSTVFGLLLAKRKVLSIFQGGKHHLQPKGFITVSLFIDIALLINLVFSSPSFKSGESWTPACLPLFNQDGFLHCYITFITSELCLVSLSLDRESFFEQSDFRSRFLENFNYLETLSECVDNDPLSVVELGISGLRHCIFKFHKPSCYYELGITAPYNDPIERKRFRSLSNP
jgi:hypothetical protein